MHLPIVLTRGRKFQVNSYSFAFAVQNFHPLLVKVPRILINTIASAAMIAIAIAGENSFESVLESFLSVIGYYVAPFTAIIPIEHYLFRREVYPLKDWNNMEVLPYGIAGVFAICAGFVGAVLSMNQTWYVGVVARSIKPDGAELGWLFSGGFALLAYVALRLLERRYTGR
jgi:purine-cytosine permease-like protein